MPSFLGATETLLFLVKGLIFCEIPQILRPKISSDTALSVLNYYTFISTVTTTNEVLNYPF